MAEEKKLTDAEPESWTEPRSKRVARAVRRLRAIGFDRTKQQRLGDLLRGARDARNAIGRRKINSDQSAECRALLLLFEKEIGLAANGGQLFGEQVCEIIGAAPTAYDLSPLMRPDLAAAEALVLRARNYRQRGAFDASDAAWFLLHIGAVGTADYSELEAPNPNVIRVQSKLHAAIRKRTATKTPVCHICKQSRLGRKRRNRTLKPQVTREV